MTSVRARPPSAVIVPIAMEVVLFLLVCLAPWAYGARHPGFEFLLALGVAVLLGLWGIRMLLEGAVRWQKCSVTFCFAGMILVGLLQLTPLPESVMGALSSANAGELLPAEPEILPDGTTADEARPRPAESLSIYPGATRVQVLRLLTLFAAFLVVIHNLASPASLRRLCIVLLANGACLSFFALLQFFTSSPEMLYWTYPSWGQVFGPFICRNHFPYYVNVCILLGVGLLLSSNARGRFDSGRGSAIALLNNPVTLWICVLLALMIAAVIISSSRGGFVALVGGLCLPLVFQLRSGPRFFAFKSLIVIVVLALGLAGFLGYSFLESRIATLWKKPLQEDRLTWWIRVLPMVQDSPILGGGLGTFPYAESRYRKTAEDSALVLDHAHNDFLELWIEGGFFGLLLALLAIGLVFRTGIRVLRTHESRRTTALVLGAIAAVATLVIHSFFDFGLRLPANALLAAVVCAYVCGLGSLSLEGTAAVPQPAPESGTSVLGRRRLAPFAGSVACFVMALILTGSFWKSYASDSLSVAAFRLHRTNPDSLKRQIKLLEAATRIDPLNAELQLDLGRAYLDQHTAEKAKLANTNWTIAAVRTFACSPPFVAPSLAPCLGSLSLCLANLSGKQVQGRNHLVEGLRHVILARDRNPYLYKAHLELAVHCQEFVRADSPSAYLNRVKLVVPANPEAWYLCGKLELELGQRDQAWKSWRHCLQLSEHYLPAILQKSSELLATKDLIDKVLPDEPALLLRLAKQRFPEEKDFLQRALFLDRALQTLATVPEPLTAAQVRLKAQALQALRRTPEAIAAYQKLLANEPKQTSSRFELARLFYETHLYKESRGELFIVLAQEPHHGPARELLAAVTRDIVTKK